MTVQQTFDFAGTASPVAAPSASGRRNIVIEAGAGTGKTTAIVAEVLRLMLEDGELSPERIVLVTFTEKAAGEIADRIHAALAELEQRFEHARGAGTTVGWPLDSSAPLLQFTADRIEHCLQACARQLGRIHLLKSQTIHSFCQSILRQFPIEAGLDPQFTVIEGFERSLLYEQLYDAWLDSETRVNADPAVLREWEVLFTNAGYLFIVRSQIFALVERRDLLQETDYEFGDINEIEAGLRSAIETVVQSPATTAMLAGLIAYFRATALPQRGDIGGWIDYFAPVATAIRELDLPKGSRNADVSEALKVLRGEGKKGSSMFDCLVAHRAAMAAHALARRFVSFLDAEKRKLGVVDFDDLLLRTLSLLGDPQVLERVRRQLDFIFVDEFQDTDRTQARILDLLARDRSGAYVPGKMVLVGDPKQSIYGFRRADPETYFRMTQQVLGGEQPRQLVGQYRSDPPLLEAINAIFGVLFPDQQHDPNVFRPSYHELTAGKARSERELDARLTFLHAGHDDREDQHISQAESIARWILAHRDQTGGDLRRFAILFRRLTITDDYLDVFDRHGIEYVLPPARTFLERRAPVDMLAVLRAIAFPFDRGAQISAARTPYFGLADDEIARGVLVRDGKTTGDDQAWRTFEEAVSRFRTAAQTRTVSQLMDAVIAATGIEAVYEQTAGGERNLRHLDHLRAIAFDYDTKIGGSLRQFVGEIDRRRSDPDEMEPLLADESRNAIRIMSVHAAKGLEFETVILPDLGFAPGNAEAAQIFVVEDPKSLVMCHPDSLSAQFRLAGGNPLKKISTLRDEAETRRLFYVAVTRARTDVVFVCSSGKNSDRSFHGCLQSAFQLDVKDLEWHEGREVRPMRVGPSTVAVAFEKLEPVEAGQRRRRKLAEAMLEEQLSDGALVPADVPLPAAEQPLQAAEVAVGRASAGAREAGILLHRVLEVWDGEGDVAALVQRLAAELGASATSVTRVRDRLGTLASSPMFQRLRAAETHARELPLRFTDASGAVVERRIDRLIRENGQDIVVDYKSGERTAERLEHDREQVAQYCEAVSRMTGRPCQGVLWYVDDDEVVAW